MLLSVDNVFKAAGQQETPSKKLEEGKQQEDDGGDNLASIKYTERIEREVLIVAGICDSENSHVINNVKIKYQGQHLSDSHFHDPEAAYENGKSKFDEDFSEENGEINSQMDLHQQLSK